MALERFVCGRARSNAYVYAPAGASCVVVDPGAGAAAPVAAFVRERRLVPEAILLTHGHPDHVWSARPLSVAWDVPVYLHPADDGWLADPACGGLLPVVRLGGRVAGRLCRLCPPRLEPMSDGDVLELAGASFRVLHTPGHTRGSVCLLTGGLCFTGDTVFAGGVGHTVYPGGDRAALRRSIRDRVLSLDDAVELRPGHGGPTTVGRSRRALEGFAGSRSETTGR